MAAADKIKAFFKNVALFVGLLLALILTLLGIGYLIWRFLLPQTVRQKMEFFMSNPQEKTDASSAAALANALDSLLTPKAK